MPRGPREAGRPRHRLQEAQRHRIDDPHRPVRLVGREEARAVGRNRKPLDRDRRNLLGERIGLYRLRLRLDDVEDGVGALLHGQIGARAIGCDDEAERELSGCREWRRVQRKVAPSVPRRGPDVAGGAVVDVGRRTVRRRDYRNAQDPILGREERQVRGERIRSGVGDRVDDETEGSIVGHQGEDRLAVP